MKNIIFQQHTKEESGSPGPGNEESRGAGIVEPRTREEEVKCILIQHESIPYNFFGFRLPFCPQHMKSGCHTLTLLIPNCAESASHPMPLRFLKKQTGSSSVIFVTWCEALSAIGPKWEKIGPKVVGDKIACFSRKIW